MQRISLKTLVLGLLLSSPLLALVGLPASQDDAVPEGGESLEALFLKNGIQLDLDQNFCAIGVHVAVREELLEYLLVASHGATHESLFATESNPAVLNTALLALGVEPGSNAQWGLKEPTPSEAELEKGVSPYTVTPPQGDGFYLYAAWQEGDEAYFFRIEDLIRNLSTGRSMQRHRWVYLGSRMIEWEKSGEQVFAAEVIGNLVNIAYFEQGDTMLTGSLEACVEQAIWMANAWLLPERGHELKLVFSRERLSEVPGGLFLPESNGLSPDGRR